jgi:hypothetical protein
VSIEESVEITIARGNAKGWRSTPCSIPALRLAMDSLILGYHSSLEGGTPAPKPALGAAVARTRSIMHAPYEKSCNSFDV